MISSWSSALPLVLPLLTNLSIKGISFELGENEINVNSFKKDNPDWDLNKIISKTGINKVFHTSSNKTAVDLAIIAINKFFLEHNFQKSEIDYLGYNVSKDGIRPLGRKVEAIQ